MGASKTLLQAIAVTAELTQTVLSPAAARVMANDLARYSESWVLPALTRCRKELKGRLTIADVIARLEDGRPGPEEAWAMLPKDEATTATWTEEMREAWGVALPLMRDGENVAARMAFKEAYQAAVLRAREEAAPVRWTATLGHDPHGREQVLVDAVAKGRLPFDYVHKLLPYRDQPSEQLKALAAGATKRIEDKAA